LPQIRFQFAVYGTILISDTSNLSNSSSAAPICIKHYQITDTIALGEQIIMTFILRHPQLKAIHLWIVTLLSFAVMLPAYTQPIAVRQLDNPANQEISNPEITAPGAKDQPFIVTMTTEIRQQLDKDPNKTSFDRVITIDEPNGIACLVNPDSISQGKLTCGYLDRH
jgi:hypothetical protein